MNISKYKTWIFGILFVPLFFIFYVEFYTFPPMGSGSDPFPVPNIKPKVVVFLWNWDEENQINSDKQHWSGFNSEKLTLPNYLGDSVEKACPTVRYCSFTTNYSQLGYADAVLFEGKPKNPNHIWDWLREPLLMPQKRPGQLWVNFGFRNTESYPLLQQPGYMSLQDINMTFDQTPRADNVPVTLFCLWGGGEKSDLLKPIPKKSSEKFAVFYSNNCGIGGARNRTAYIKELMQYIPIDSYGDCLNNKDLPSEFAGMKEELKDDTKHGEGIKKLIKLYSQYKFVISFERNNVTDFVTQKLMLGFQAGSLNIYMGAPNVQSWLPGDNSIIRTDKYQDPKHLSDYLHQLDQSDDEYNTYFKWKKNGLSKNFEDKMSKCVFYNSHCRLCEAVAKIQLAQQPNYIKGLDKDIILNDSYALQFNGQSSYVEIDDHPELRLADVYSITAWIYIEGTTYDFRIIDKNTAGTTDGFGLDILNRNERNFLRLCSSSGCFMGMKPLFANTWYHVAVVFVSSNAGEKIKAEAGIFFYVNGEVDYRIPYPVPMYGLRPNRKNNLPLRIGRAGSGNSFWKGKIDDVSLWNIPLSMEYIRTLMFQRLGGKEEGLVGYWGFNEGPGHSVTIDNSKARRDAKVYDVTWLKSERKEFILNTCI